MRKAKGWQTGATRWTGCDLGRRTPRQPSLLLLLLDRSAVGWRRKPSMAVRLSALDFALEGPLGSTLSTGGEDGEKDDRRKGLRVEAFN